SKDDFVLLFFSGHGITDDTNHLYLTTQRTAKHNFEATAVPAQFVQQRSARCYAKRQVIILDCCYSGAFKDGWHLKSVGLDLRRDLGIDPQGGEGRAVLTSSSATQTSFQQDGENLSLYTQYLVEGIETGIADNDCDGNIFIQELHQYAKAKVQGAKPKQKPEIILDKEGFNILISHAPLKDPKLRFRREAEEYASQNVDYLQNHGDFSPIGKITLLQAKRKEIGLTESEAQTILDSIREPYRHQLENQALYRQAVEAAFTMGYPLAESVQRELEILRNTLGLRDTEAEEIEHQTEAPARAYWEQQQQELQRQQALDREWEQQRQAELEQQRQAEAQRREAERQKQLAAQREQQAELERKRKQEQQREAEGQRREAKAREERLQQQPKLQKDSSPKTLQNMGRRKFTILGISGAVGAVGIAIIRGAMQPDSPDSGTSDNPSETELTNPSSSSQANLELPTQPFSFQTATVDQQGTITQKSGEAEAYVEDLGNGVLLRMVAIRGGTFLMGSPPDEPERFDWEGPQHEVTVPDFFMGIFAITQTQYQAIIGSNPAYFKGEDRPVENVSWNDAIAFCQRLSERSGKPYDLPSEAQWEYACRAGTTTPFAFGNMITPELANYDWKTSYNGSPTRSSSPRETQLVGSYPANAWGLYDMHGCVWEWCKDTWHSNYEGAPTDGSAWIEGGDSDPRLRRGGSWHDIPRNCRSAYRDTFPRDNRSNIIGFRVACPAPRALPL
ncbi:MAG: SUMF1/EgtB/PvdO family nonheme iron enzyme, partial [Prochlorotrichaceae cyanobacterium]